MHRAPREGLEDEEVKRSTDEIEVVGHGWLLA
jgi:hypothetical protein